MYKLTAYAKTRRALPGVNWRDLSDEEYAAALAANPGMDQHGYFEKAEEEAAPRRGNSVPTPAIDKADAVETAEENTND